MGRILMMTLFAADINEESRKPAKILRSIPSSGFCSEVSMRRKSIKQKLFFILIQANRFLEEVTHSKICLTGMKFFSLTRSLIISVAGTIVTYEIVLIQFQLLTPSNERNPCLKTIL